MNKSSRNILTFFAILFAIIWILAMMMLPYLWESMNTSYFWMEKKPPDHVAIEELLDFIGMEKIAQNSKYDKSTSHVFNDTLVGLKYSDHKYFIQSLEDTSYLKVFEAKEEAPERYQRNNRKRVNLYYAPHIRFYRNGALYFTDGFNHLHRVYKDGSWEQVFPWEVLAEIGTPIKNESVFWYYPDNYVITTRIGVFVVSEETGEIEWSHIFRDFLGWDYIQTALIGDYIVFKEYLRDEDNTLIVCFNLKEGKMQWQKKFQNSWMPGRFKPNNNTNITRIYDRRNSVNYFLSLDNGKVIKKTYKRESNLAIHQVGSQTRKYFYKNPFSPFVEDEELIVHRDQDGLLQRINILTDSVIWESPAKGYVHFIYDEYIITRETKPYKGDRYNVVVDKHHVYNVNHGKHEATIEVGGATPGRFYFKESYLFYEDKIYK